MIEKIKTALLNLSSSIQAGKIYFAGSIRGGREDAACYHQINALFIECGEVLTKHIGNRSHSNAFPFLLDLGEGEGRT